MVNWLIIGVLVVLLWLFFRARYMQHKLYAILIIVLLLFFYVTGLKIIKENNIDVTNFNGMVSAGKLYFKWLGHAIQNTKTIIGNAIKMDWIDNASLETK